MKVTLNGIRTLLFIWGLTGITAPVLCQGQSVKLNYLLDQHARAMGGSAHWDNLESLSKTVVRSGGAPMQISYLAPDKVLQRFGGQVSSFTRGTENGHAYTVRNGIYEPSSVEEGKKLILAAKSPADLLLARKNKYAVEYQGTDSVDGIPCYQIIVRTAQQDTLIYWLNQSTFLIEQVSEFSTHHIQAGIQFRTRWLDYREVAGYLFPFQQKVITNEAPPIVFQITSLAVNAPQITPEQFAYHPDNTANLIRFWKHRYQDDQLKGFSFVQETITFKGGKQDTAVWKEVIQYPDRFRIDFGEKEALNRNLYRNDSIYALRKGQEVHRGKQIQEFMLMEGGLYAFPVDTTLSKLERIGVNAEKFYQTIYKGRRTYVIGADSSDFRSPQIWLDAEHRYCVRRMSKTRDGKILEVEYSDFKLVDGHYIETWLRFLLDGELIQTERYYDIQVNPEIDPAVFDPQQYQDTYWY